MCVVTRGRLLNAAALLFCSVVASGQSVDPASESRRAKDLMAAGKFEQAVPIYEQLVKAFPGNPGLLLNLGLAEEMAGHPDKAIPHFEAVLKTQPDSIPALTSLGTAELQLNRPRLAIAPLEKLIRLQPDDSNARGMLAGAEMSLNRFDEAAEQYRKLTSSDGSDPKGWYGLGKAYESLATRSFDRLSKTSLESPYVAALLADSRLQLGQYRSAFFFYGQAGAKLPDLPGLHTGLAKVYESTGHPEWAEAERKKEQSSSAKCVSLTAECRFLNGDLLGAAKSASASATTPASLFWATRAYNQLARAAFDHLSELPESVEIHALKAEISGGHGQSVDAAEQWKAALALAPGDVRLETELANALFLAHRYEELIPMLTRMLGRDPNAPELNFMMGQSLWRTQQAEKAVPYLTAALKADPEMLPAHAALGMLYAALNNNAEAVPHLQKAVTIDDDGSLHYSLARAYQAAGDSAKAQSTMQQYQQIRQKNQEVNDQLAKEAEITAPK